MEKKMNFVKYESYFKRKTHDAKKVLNQCKNNEVNNMKPNTPHLPRKGAITASKRKIKIISEAEASLSNILSLKNVQNKLPRRIFKEPQNLIIESNRKIKVLHSRGSSLSPISAAPLSQLKLPTVKLNRSALKQRSESNYNFPTLSRENTESPYSSHRRIYTEIPQVISISTTADEAVKETEVAFFANQETQTDELSADYFTGTPNKMLPRFPMSYKNMEYVNGESAQSSMLENASNHYKTKMMKRAHSKDLHKDFFLWS
jgi:hypothetical protein